MIKQYITSGPIDGAYNVATDFQDNFNIKISKKPDFFRKVLIHGVFNYWLLIFLPLIIFNRVTIMPHGQLDVYNTRRSFKKKIYLWLIKNIVYKAEFIFLSEDEKKRSLITGKKNHICPNFVNFKDLNLSKPNLCKFNFSSEKTLEFIYWGRVDSEHKGIDRLIKFILELNNREYKFRLKIIGPLKDSIAKKNIQKLSNILDAKFQYIDFVPRENIKNHIKSNSILLLFSKHEGMPLTALEAMLFGIPILVTSETNLTSTFGDSIYVHDPDNIMKGFLELINDKNIIKRVSKCQRTLEGLSLIRGKTLNQLI